MSKFEQVKYLLGIVGLVLLAMSTTTLIRYNDAKTIKADYTYAVEEVRECLVALRDDSLVTRINTCNYPLAKLTQTHMTIVISIDSNTIDTDEVKDGFTTYSKEELDEVLCDASENKNCTEEHTTLITVAGEVNLEEVKRSNVSHKEFIEWVSYDNGKNFIIIGTILDYANKHRRNMDIVTVINLLTLIAIFYLVYKRLSLLRKNNERGGSSGSY